MLDNYIKSNSNLFAELSPITVASTLVKMSAVKAYVLNIGGLIVMWDGDALYNKDGKIVDMPTPPKESIIIDEDTANEYIVNDYLTTDLFILNTHKIVHGNRTILPVYDKTREVFSFDGADYSRDANIYQVALGLDFKNFFCEVRGNKVIITEVLGSKNKEQIHA